MKKSKDTFLKIFSIFFINVGFISYCNDNYYEYDIPEYYLPSKSYVIIVSDAVRFSYENSDQKVISGKIWTKTSDVNEIKIKFSRVRESKISILNYLCELLGCASPSLIIDLPDESIVEFVLPNEVYFRVQSREM